MDKRSAREAYKNSDIHLVVLQHGLWGSPNDVSRLAEYLKSAFDAQQHGNQHQQRTEVIQVVNSTCNERALTYDGVDVCGARLAKFIQDTAQQLLDTEGARVTKLSLVGYSLGGLIVRYAAGKLYVAGFFEEVQPANLITIATPHLGSFKEPTSWLARFFNSQVAIIASRTGMQLMLADTDYSVPWLAHQQALHNQAHKEYEQRHSQELPQLKQYTASLQQHRQASSSAEQPQQTSAGTSSEQQQQRQRIALPPGIDPSGPVPLLLLMAHPAGPFYKALTRFKTRMCAANIKYDTTVPYCTAAICISNPYEECPPVSVDPAKYPSVVRPATADEAAQHPDAKGKGRLYMFMLFLPLFPFFWAYSATKGALHHRRARQRPLDEDWLQQYADVLSSGLSSLTSRQASRQLPHRQVQAVSTGAKAARTGFEAGSSTVAAEGEDKAQLLGNVGSSPFAVAAAAAPASAAVGPIGRLGGAAVDRTAPAGLQQLLNSRSSSPQKPAAVSGPGATANMAQQQMQQAPTEYTGVDETSDVGVGYAPSPVVALTRTEEDVLRASGSAMLSPQISRRLSTLGPLEHEGIIAAVGNETRILQQQQQWMAQQLFDNMPPCIVCERCKDAVSGSDTEAAGASRNTSSSSAGDDKVCSSSTGAVQVQDVQLEPSTAESNSFATCAAYARQGNPEQVQQKQDRKCGAGLTGGSTSVGLSKGGWHRIDVWTGHMHAHATIIIRDKRYESQSRDFFEYIANHMSS